MDTLCPLESCITQQVILSKKIVDEAKGHTCSKKILMVLFKEGCRSSGRTYIDPEVLTLFSVCLLQILVLHVFYDFPNFLNA